MRHASRCTFALCVALALAAPAPRAAAGPAGTAPSRIGVSVRGRGGGMSPWDPDAPHAFLLGGPTITGTRSMRNALWVRGGEVSSGVELPTRWRWAFVPRAHAVFGFGPHAGTVTWIRAAGDARFTSRSGGLLRYYEGGAGMSLVDSPVDTRIGVSTTRTQRSSGSPFAQILLGLRSGADEGPGAVLEVIFVLGGGIETPGGAEVMAGISF